MALAVIIGLQSHALQCKTGKLMPIDLLSNSNSSQGHYWLLGRIVLAMMAGLTGLEGFIGFCMGCVMFSAGIQLGVFPATVHRLFLQTHHEKK